MIPRKPKPRSPIPIADGPDPAAAATTTATAVVGAAIRDNAVSVEMADEVADEAPQEPQEPQEPQKPVAPSGPVGAASVAAAATGVDSEWSSRRDADNRSPIEIATAQDEDKLAACTARSDEVQRLAASAQASAGNSKAKESAAEWRTMQAALQRKLRASRDLDDDSDSGSGSDTAAGERFHTAPSTPATVAVSFARATPASPQTPPQAPPATLTSALSRGSPGNEKGQEQGTTGRVGHDESHGAPSWLSKVPLRFVQLQRGAAGLGFQIQKAERCSIRVVEVPAFSVLSLSLSLASPTSFPRSPFPYWPSLGMSPRRRLPACPPPGCAPSPPPSHPLAPSTV